MKHKPKSIQLCVLLDLAHVTEAFHLLKDFVDVWHHILAINHDGFVGAVSQSHMEHSTALCTQRKHSQDLHQS